MPTPLRAEVREVRLALDAVASVLVLDPARHAPYTQIPAIGDAKP